MNENLKSYNRSEATESISMRVSIYPCNYLLFICLAISIHAINLGQNFFVPVGKNIYIELQKTYI